MSEQQQSSIGEAPWFHVILSTGLGTGFTPVAPGTAGALLALAIWYVLFDGVASGVICYHFGADRGNDICWCMDIERDGALLGS